MSAMKRILLLIFVASSILASAQASNIDAIYKSIIAQAYAQQPQSQSNCEKPHTTFAWGANAGASIDMSGQDMSAIEFSASFGMRRGWINFLGVGMGADLITSNSSRCYPIFIDFQTNFRNSPTLFFWSIRSGISLNYLEHNHDQVGAYASTGLGINLARGNSFCSYMFIGYTFRQRNNIEDEFNHEFKSLHYVSCKIGLNF